MPRGISREIMEEHFLLNAPVGHGGLAHRAGMTAHQHDTIAGAARPVAGDGVSVDLGIRLPGVATAEVIDGRQAVFFHLR